jgi:MYXO-CTERM domain-containing protein
MRLTKMAVLGMAVAACGGVSPGSYGRQEPAAALRARFPEGAKRALGGDGFAATQAGFSHRVDTGDAVEAAGLHLQLPTQGASSAHFEVDGFAFALSEEGASGPGQLVERAVAYPRERGTSFWTATPEGYEEWLHIARPASAGSPWAQWRVAGAKLRSAPDGAELLDDQGRPRVRVTAPVALEPSGRRARAWLRVEGDQLLLFTDAADADALVDPAWSSTGSLASARAFHTATLLPSGKVLVAGGGGNGVLASAELYDPDAGTWTTTGSLATARELHTATLLLSGQVLVAGGFNGAALASAELYDPTTGTWSATGSLGAARAQHAASLLPSGKVLVEGGSDGANSISSAEVYDPTPGTWSPTGSLTTARQAQTATLLPSQKVLVAGGGNGATLASAELYDSSTGAWTDAGSLATARYFHTATLLPSGKVLVAGGTGPARIASAELFDPASGMWSTTGGLAVARESHTGTLLRSGKVLVAAGFGSAGDTASAELYDPASGTWSATRNLALARDAHTATLLPSGQVLVAGGEDVAVVASAELYDPGCTTAADCASGLECVSGTCASPADAGMQDSGSPDAGLSDAGEADAGQEGTKGRGCGCSTGPTGALAWLAVVAAWRRKRR